MTREREHALTRDSSQELTPDERGEGWHFCMEFDGLLTTGEMLREDGVTCICGFDRRKVQP